MRHPRSPAGGTPRAARAASPGGPTLQIVASAGFRFALLFAGVFAVAALAFSAVLWFGAAAALDRQTDAEIRTDAVALLERGRADGLAAVAAAIAERLELDIESDSLYLLVDRDRQVRGGNLDAWPTGLDHSAIWFYWQVTRDGSTVEARFFRQPLPDGAELLVGRDVADKLLLRDVLGEGLAWAAIAMALGALLGAVLLRGALQRRLGPAYATAAAIAAGDLSQRVPLTDRDDEFDRLALTMNTMLDRIARLMEGVRGVSDAIAHDLRTPIARARNKLEEALDSSGDAATLRAAIEQGIADLDGITRVFQAVLRIAEAEAGARRAAFAAFDLQPVLADAAELYGATAEARGQTLSIDLPEPLPMVGDRDLVLQAVANLLDNAVKFSPEGGAISLSAHTDDGAVTLTVADSGPGLAAAERARAGERFFRADAARATPGSGLGLSLVRAVAALHGGELLLADAAPGAEPPGLAATLRLPMG